MRKRVSKLILRFSLVLLVAESASAPLFAAPRANPSVQADVGRIVVVSVVVRLLAASEGGSHGIISELPPRDLPAAILIPGARPLLTMGRTRLRGTLHLVTPTRNLAGLSVLSRKGSLSGPERISVKGKITIPSISYGPAVDKYGVLVEHGPFEGTGLQVVGRLTAPATAIDAVKVSGIEIMGSIEVMGAITITTTADGVRHLAIEGPITIDGPVSILSIAYGTDWDALTHPGPLIIKGPITIAGPIDVELRGNPG